MEHALWVSLQCRVSWWSSWKIELMIIWLLYLCNCIGPWCRMIDPMSFAYSLDKLCSHFYGSMIKFDKPHVSTKCIVLWIRPASTKCTYGAVIKLFCRFSPKEWPPRSSRRSRQSGWTVELAQSLCKWCLGQGHYYCYLILSKYPLRLDSES